MQRILILLLFFSGTFASVEEISLHSGGYERVYYLQKPVSVRKNTPIVIVLHGAGGKASHYLHAKGFSELAQKEGFILVVPEGLPSFPLIPANFLLNPRVWNSGVLRIRKKRAQINDVDFLDAVIRDVRARLSNARGPLFIAGHSNGASMAFRMAAQSQEPIRAIAPFASHSFETGIATRNNLGVFYLLGSEDPLVPLAGGARKLPWRNSRQEVPPVQNTIIQWKNALECQGLSEQVPSEIPDYEQTSYSCKRGNSFQVGLIRGHGHEFPGGRPSPLPESMIGNQRKDVPGAALIWNFFRSQL